MFCNFRESKAGKFRPSSAFNLLYSCILTQGTAATRQPSPHHLSPDSIDVIPASHPPQSAIPCQYRRELDAEQSAKDWLPPHDSSPPSTQTSSRTQTRSKFMTRTYCHPTAPARSAYRPFLAKPHTITRGKEFHGRPSLYRLESHQSHLAAQDYSCRAHAASRSLQSAC